MQTTCTLIRKAQPMGEYEQTAVDATKAVVDFRLTDVTGPKNRIIWKDGRSESVTDDKLKQLQAAHTWTTDF